MSNVESILLTLNGDSELEDVIRNQFDNPFGALVHIYPDCTLMTLIPLQMSDKLPLDCCMKTVKEGLFENPCFDSTKDIAVCSYTDNCIYLFKDNLYFKKHKDNYGFSALYPFTNSFYRLKFAIIDLYEKRNNQQPTT